MTLVSGSEKTRNVADDVDGRRSSVSKKTHTHTHTDRQTDRHVLN